MKKSLLVILPVVSLALAACSGSRTMHTDAVEIADSINETHAGVPGYDKAGAAFLVDATDARLMDIKEGRIAAKKGSSPAIRSYGRLMVKEQTALLGALRKLAGSQHVALPNDISNSKKEGFSELAELEGDDFDSKFVKMMIIDHQRDVKEFKDAQTLGNTSVAAFARGKLPQIQTHLDKIEAIRDQRKK